MTFEDNLTSGRIAEGTIGQLLMKAGWTVVPVYDIERSTGKGPQVFSATRHFIAPDICAFNGTRVEFFEAKHKRHFSWSRRCNNGKGAWDTGVDLRHYHDYLALRHHLNRPIWLLFLHRSQIPSSEDLRYGCPPKCPIGLFGGEIEDLRIRACHDDMRHAKGMVYWCSTRLDLFMTAEQIRRAERLMMPDSSISIVGMLSEEQQIIKQKNCAHPQLARTTVGGFTCDFCGVYLFHKPGCNNVGCNCQSGAPL